MEDALEDLEALKELNDELEENHVETEKALQEDIGKFKCSLCSYDDLTTLRIDAKDIQIHEMTRKIQSLEEACQDLEGTIVQFRELVLSLQT